MELKEAINEVASFSWSPRHKYIGLRCQIGPISPAQIYRQQTGRTPPCTMSSCGLETVNKSPLSTRKMQPCCLQTSSRNVRHFILSFQRFSYLRATHRPSFISDESGSYPLRSPNRSYGEEPRGNQGNDWSGRQIIVKRRI